MAIEPKNTNDVKFDTLVEKTPGVGVIIEGMRIQDDRPQSVTNAVARTEYPSVAQIQDNSVLFGGTSGGSANVQTIAVTPAITAYVDGQRFLFIAGFTNTAAMTLNINGVGAKTVSKVNFSDTLVDLVNRDIRANGAFEVEYDSGADEFILIDAAVRRTDLTWTPTYGGTGSMTFTSVTTTIARYYRVDNIIKYWLVASGTTGGVAASGITFTPPEGTIKGGTSALIYGHGVMVDGAPVQGSVFFNNATTLRALKTASANWTLGAGRQILVTGLVEVT